MKREPSTGAKFPKVPSAPRGSEVERRRKWDREFVGPPVPPKVMRSMLAAVLHASGDNDLAAVLDRCATPLHVTCTCCGSTKWVEQGCKKRWCPVCGPKLSAEKVARFRFAWERMEWPLMVVLTVRSRAYAEESIRWLVGKFFDFRRGKWWKACDVKGGIRGLEITWSEAGWHPHIHLLIDCRWLAWSAKAPQAGWSKTMIKAACEAAQHELAVKWAAHVGQENSMVWVKRTAQDGIKEVVKYTVKHSDLLELGSKAAEVIRAMRHTRATQAFGSCHGIGKELKAMEDEHKPAAKCEGCENPSWIPSAMLDRRIEPLDEIRREMLVIAKKNRELEARMKREEKEAVVEKARQRIYVLKRKARGLESP